MYEEKFGFNKRPFRATPHGAEVFVGPQTAQTMQGLKKALTTSDGVVTVTGPAGSGKTTQVVRALEAIDSGCTCIRIGRMHLGPDEILEFLLAKLGVQSPPKSTIRRVVFFRAAVMQKRLAGHRVFIVVEDAQRLGLDALAELEALTGAENGDGDGANLILMAPQSLKPLLRSEGLERLDQRVRLRHQIKALNEAELCAYLKHCFRLAGAEFDLIFKGGAEKQLYAFSAGIPRVANNLVESVLTAAAEQGIDKIGPDLISEIASAEYEMTVESLVPTFDAPEPPAVAETTAASEPAVETAPEPAQTEVSSSEDDDLAEPAPVAEAPVVEAAAADEIVAAPEEASEPEAVEATTIVNDEDVAANLPEPPAPEPEAPPIAEPAAVEAPAEVGKTDSGADAEESDFEIPDLIQDTLPDLEILAPEVMERNAISDAEMDAEEIPTLYSSMRMKAPLAEPAKLSDDEDGKVFIGQDAEPVPVAEPAATIAEPETPVAAVEPAVPEPKPSPELAQARPDVPASAPELPPVLEAEPPVAPAIEQAAAPEPAAIVASAPTTTATEDSPAAPDVLAAAQVEPAAADGEIPAWERDPTLAQLKPDIEALESAMAEFADDESKAPAKEEAEEPLPEVELKDPTMPSLPEITLDAAIEEKIREAEEALEKHDATIAEDEEPTITDSERDTRADAELEKIAEGLARAKTIEDVDDKMAETLFGEEISMIAAQVAVAGPANESQIEPEVAPGSPPAAESIELSAEPATVETSPEPEPESEFEREFREVYGEKVDISLETKPKPGMDLSASQRLATVRALNAGIVQPPGPTPDAAQGANVLEPPASIEDQIDTSLSQTIKTLNIDPSSMANDDDDDDEENTKGGFFSRFRRS